MTHSTTHNAHTTSQPSLNATYLTAGKASKRKRGLFRTLAIGAEAGWAKQHITLAEEPQGARHGRVLGEGADPTARPIRVLAVGDSMIAGCGTSDQSKGLIPQMATMLSARLGVPVEWRTDAKLGATIRRVRYRQLAKLEPKAKDGKSGEANTHKSDTPTTDREADIATCTQFDVIYIGAGSNDIMARRKISEWSEELRECIQIAHRHAPHVAVMSCGQLQMIPVLGKSLRIDLERLCDEQAKATQAICDDNNARYINMVHEDLHCDEFWFWCGDQFHPCQEGYRVLATHCLNSMPQEVLESLLNR